MNAKPSIAEAALALYDNSTYLTKADLAPLIPTGAHHDQSLTLVTDKDYVFAWPGPNGWSTHTRPRHDRDWDHPMFQWPSARTAMNRALCRLELEVSQDLHDRGLIDDPRQDQPDEPIISVEQAEAVYPSLKDMACMALSDNNASDMALQALDETESSTADDMEGNLSPDIPNGASIHELLANAILAQHHSEQAA